MTPNVESEIKKIVARSFPTETVERQMLEKVFAALAKHQENFLRDLEKRIDAENCTEDWNKNFEVAVKFVKRGDTESVRGLLPVEVGTGFIFAEDTAAPLEESLNTRTKNFAPPEISFFVNASYSEIENFCAPKEYHGLFVSKDGTKKNFAYTLQRHERFIYHEKILFELAALYKIRRPIIFSPYARKAVDIKISGVTTSDFANRKIFDLLLTENNLQEKLQIGGLYWNVQIEEDELKSGGAVEEYFGADGNLIRYEYFHTFNNDENIFVLPAQPCENLNVEISGGERKFKIGYSSVLQECAYKKITLLDFEKNDAEFFTNDFPRPNDKLRLRTEGDVEKVLACFNATRAGKIFPANFESFNAKNFKPLPIYRREDKYFIAPETRLLGKVRNKPICVINFGGAGVFKIDYANFVIHYLEQNYPEFNWAGVES